MNRRHAMVLMASITLALGGADVGFVSQAWAAQTTAPAEPDTPEAQQALETQLAQDEHRARAAQDAEEARQATEEARQPREAGPARTSRQPRVVRPGAQATPAPVDVAVMPAPLSKTRYARRVLVIALDRAAPDWMQISNQLDAIAARLAPNVLNVKPDDVSDVVSFRGDFDDDRCSLTVTVRLPDEENVRPAAREFADQLVRDLKAFVEDSRQKKSREDVVPNEKAVEEARTGYESAIKKYREMQTRIRERSGRVDVTPERFGDAAAQLDEEKMRLELEQAAKLARREALTAALADASKRMEKSIREDAIVDELQKVVQSREKAIEKVRKLVEQGAIGDDELRQATEALADARVRLLERQREAAEHAGGDVLSDWNRELMSLTVDERELAARLDQVRDRLKAMRSMLDSMDDLRRMQDDLQRSRADLEEAQQRLRVTVQRLRALEQAHRVSIREADDERQTPTTEPAQPAPRRRTSTRAQ